LSAAIMVGDAGPDVGVARRAGIPVIGVEFGYTDVPIAELKPDRLIGHMREDVPALEILLDLSQKAGDTTHITELYELLAHASVQGGNLEKARDYYLKLTQMEPQNQLHTRNYEQVLAKLGGASSSSRLITPEEGAVLVEELEATAPFIDQRYADDVALAVRAALTDAELFVSYNMPAKALGPLMSALPKAPRDLRINQRLAALHTRLRQRIEAGEDAINPFVALSLPLTPATQLRIARQWARACAPAHAKAAIA